MGTLGIREKYPDIDPGQALLSEMQISHAHVQWLRAKVAEIEPNELVWGITKTEARKIALAEHQGAMFGRALQEIFGKLSLSQTQSSLLSTIVPAALRQRTEI